MMLGNERGPCPDAADMGAMERFRCKMAIAPTASISIIAGGTSACIEPIPANIYTHKTLSGSFSIKNPYLEKLLAAKAKDSSAVWNSILEMGGSVQHLDFLTAEEKDVYKTSFEIDQRWLLELAADRTPFIDQAQSLNLFIPADVDKWDLMMLHFRAWELGIKSLYYLRSKSVQRAGFAGGVEADNTHRSPRDPGRLDDGLRRMSGVPVNPLVFIGLGVLVCPGAFPVGLRFLSARPSRGGEISPTRRGASAALLMMGATCCVVLPRRSGFHGDLKLTRTWPCASITYADMIELRRSRS